MRKSSSHHVRRADQIDVHDDTKVNWRQFIGRSEKITGGSGDENINVFELRTGGFERPADGCETPHIGGNSHDFIARRRKRTDGRVDVFLLATRNRHLCAVPGEGSGDAEIDFSGAAKRRRRAC
jgi:hypothetical protein